MVSFFHFIQNTATRFVIVKDYTMQLISILFVCIEVGLKIIAS